MFRRSAFSLFKTSAFTLEKIKCTTGLVGVPVQPRWREMMLKLIDDVLVELRTLPANTFYRVSNENNFRFFKKVVEENPEDYEKVEAIINRGQVEELIMLFEDMLVLIPKYREWKPWEVTEKDAELEKMHFESLEGKEPALPSEFVLPEFDEYKTFSGIYQVEYTEEEEKEMDKKQQQQQQQEKESSQKV